MDKIMIFINKQKLHILILMTFCLVFISKVAIADDASPGIPPQMMKNFHISSNSEIKLQSPLSVSNPFNIFIPYIRNDRSGLTVNLLNRQNSLNFYVDQYLTSEKVEINWTGNHSACDSGTTDQNFRNAVLRRI